jgi:acetyl esterase
MPQLDPDLARLLGDMQAAALPAYESMTPGEARRSAAERNAPWNREVPELPLVRDHLLEAPGRAIPIRLYGPSAAEEPGPAVVFAHGGGWVLCSPETHDGLCRRLALAGGFKVVSVDYRLAPEHPFPAGLDDVAFVVEHLAEHGGAHAIDGRRLALAGDSAGANLALATCLRLRDAGHPAPKAAALIYGAYAPDFDTASQVAFGDGRYVLSTRTMRWFWQHYAPDPASRRDRYAAPLFADLSGLPPLYLSAAELDPLRDDTERLARRLIDHGAAFDYRLWRGLTHAVMNWSPRVPRVEGLIAEIAAFLARRLAWPGG